MPEVSLSRVNNFLLELRCVREWIEQVLSIQLFVAEKKEEGNYIFSSTDSQ